MTLVATIRAAGDQIELASPGPGLFRASVHVGDVVRPGSTLGLLEVLGRVIEVVAPEVGGVIVALSDPQRARPAVDHGATLVTLDPRAGAVATGSARPAAASATAATGLVFRAPTSGRFYGRATPDKPPFVSAGDELAPGTTVCLLEVMKTFHRVTYGGADVPARARVLDVLVADGADVNAGDPLLSL